MLSLKKGTPIAKILGDGRYSGRTLHLVENPMDKLSERAERQLKRLEVWELQAIKDAIEKGSSEDLSDKLSLLYDDIVGNDESICNEFKLPSPHQLQPIPNKEARECYYVAGPSGSGKSTYISKYIEHWRKNFPNKKEHPIVLFSRVSEDECLDAFEPLRIPINESLKEDPIDLTELEGSLVIFDDVDQINNANKLKDYVINLRDQILEEGRHKNIYCCTTSHQMTNYKATRIPLTEASHCVFFPRCGATQPIRYFLQHYIGLDKDQIQRIMSLPSRWVCLKKTYPMVVMYEQGAYML